MNLDEGKAIAVDQPGYVYVTGIGIGGANNTRQYIMIKYSSTGDSVWANRHVGPRNSYAAAIVVDRDGCIYVTWESENTSHAADFPTIKYNSNGDRLWVGRYDIRP